MSIIIIALKFSRSFTQNNKKQNAANTRENMDVQQRTNKRSLRAPAWCEKLFCATKKKYIYRYILIRVRNLWCTKYNSQREEKEKKVRKKKPRKRPKYLSKRQTWVAALRKRRDEKEEKFHSKSSLHPKTDQNEKKCLSAPQNKTGSCSVVSPTTVLNHHLTRRGRERTRRGDMMTR